MAEPQRPQVLLRNRRAQPVELHLPGGVCTLPPLGQAVLDASLLDTPQLAWMLARKALDVLPAPGPAAAAAADAAPAAKVVPKAAASKAAAPARNAAASAARPAPDPRKQQQGNAS